MPWIRVAPLKIPLLAALAAAAAVAAIRWSGLVRDMDEFYHARLSALVAVHGPLEAFPWLPLTAFGAPFADQHVAFHVLTAAMVRVIGDPFVALGIVVAFGAAAAVAVFVAGLRARGVSDVWVFFALLLASTGFLYRVSLGKASGIAVALALATFFLALERRPRTLAVVAALWTLAHGGWPLAVAVLGAVLIARAITGEFAAADRRVVAWAVGGLVLGNVLHPNAPDNLRFAWEQFVQIGVIGYGDAVAVGAEWSSPTLAMLWNGAGLALLALGVACVLRFRRPPVAKWDAATLASLLVAAGLLALTLRSYRHVEYLVPFLLVAAALVTPARSGIQKQKEKNSVVRIAVAAVLVILVLRNVNGIRAAVIADGIPQTRYAAVGAWLTDNAAPGDVVFHAAWDDFPPLWYHAPDQAYIAGLDPVFLYRADPERYALWRHIAEGKLSAPVSGPLKSAFGARYVLVRPQDDPLANAIRFDAEHFDLVHEDPEAKLYILK